MDLLSVVREEIPFDKRIFYRCERSSELGISEDHHLVTGMALVPYLVEGYDSLHEEVSEMGLEGEYKLPSLEEGRIYEVLVTDIRRDWETGYADEWTIKLVEVTDPDTLNQIESRRRELETE